MVLKKATTELPQRGFCGLELGMGCYSWHINSLERKKSSKKEIFTIKTKKGQRENHSHGLCYFSKLKKEHSFIAKWKMLGARKAFREMYLPFFE